MADIRRDIVRLALPLLMAIFGLCTSAGAQLSIGPGARILRNGKPYRAIGVNYFDCFGRTLANGYDASYDAGFATLAEKGIPFARFCCTGYWPKDMQLYQTDRAEYFRRLDGVVNSARKHGVGLVPSLFFYHACVPDLVGEPMDQWGDPKSKTQAWMRQYVREVVTRYRDNSAIWAWEFANECSLAANLPRPTNKHRPAIVPTLGTPTTRSTRDDLTVTMLREAFADFATEVRKYDPDRLILTGDSILRPSAWHQEHEGSWKRDTPEQFEQMLVRVNPDPINCISIHMYGDSDQNLGWTMEVSRKLNKPLFVGEFGVEKNTPEDVAHLRRLLKAVVDQQAPLAALWVYDFSHQKDLSVTATNARAWQLELIAEANKQLHGG